MRPDKEAIAPRAASAFDGVSGREAPSRTVDRRVAALDGTRAALRERVCGGGLQRPHGDAVGRPRWQIDEVVEWAVERHVRLTLTAGQPAAQAQQWQRAGRVAVAEAAHAREDETVAKPRRVQQPIVDGTQLEPQRACLQPQQLHPAER